MNPDQLKRTFAFFGIFGREGNSSQAGKQNRNKLHFEYSKILCMLMWRYALGSKQGMEDCCIGRVFVSSGRRFSCIEKLPNVRKNSHLKFTVGSFGEVHGLFFVSATFQIFNHDQRSDHNVGLTRLTHSQNPTFHSHIRYRLRPDHS